MYDIDISSIFLERQYSMKDIDISNIDPSVFLERQYSMEDIDIEKFNDINEPLFSIEDVNIRRFIEDDKNIDFYRSSKELMKFKRNNIDFTLESAIYITTVIEYLIAELMELSGNDARDRFRLIIYDAKSLIKDIRGKNNNENIKLKILLDEFSTNISIKLEYILKSLEDIRGKNKNENIKLEKTKNFLREKIERGKEIVPKDIIWAMRNDRELYPMLIASIKNDSELKRLINNVIIKDEILLSNIRGLFE